MKTCTSCGAPKSLDEFHRRAASPDGRCASCKVCIRARQKAWRERHNYYPEKPHPRRDEWDLVCNVPDLLTRVVKHALIGDGCWEWQAAKSLDGYGMVTVDWHMYRPYRLMWQWWYRKPIPEGMQVDHICRTRSCIRPDHLRVVTPQVNSIENNLGPSARNARKTHCKYGHPFEGGNVGRTREGHRICRACRRRIDRERRAREREVEA